MSDLQKVIAAYRGMTAQYYSHDFISISHTDLTRLLDAAEAGAKALAAAKALADACDDVGVRFFDTDTMEPEVQAMQEATAAVRALRGAA